MTVWAGRLWVLSLAASLVGAMGAIGALGIWAATVIGKGAGRPSRLH